MSQVFYFTFGDCDDQPYCGGWSVVEADTLIQAVAAFNAYHPTPDLVRCAMIYTETEFKKTEMYKEGNKGAREHERIVLARTSKEVTQCTI
ncbi:MAG: hypothetical protein IKM36_03590 [Oscillospiraceae bacterium]|nr:hypothetical protein [Oscillospiraceae bacterium]MBR2365931.1 hypothetical protein [Oscillospiraceae bacterium]MBR3849559.1 hypothetical protein [Oscillospiraceae bacterium]